MYKSLALVACLCPLIARAEPLTPEEARSRYARSLADLEAERIALAAGYRRARTEKARRRVLAGAEAAVYAALRERILPAWYGTDWAFGGRSETPGQGAIACGIFVGTVLRDAGFRLDRIALGRLASEHIALSLTGERNLRRWSNRPAGEVAGEVSAWGRGLYAVGLDYHAGLIVVDPGGAARFVHSGIGDPANVRSEPLAGPNLFAASHYRVVARLLDGPMMRKWLLGERFEAKKKRKLS